MRKFDVVGSHDMHLYKEVLLSPTDTAL
jgi:hypothetical protein